MPEASPFQIAIPKADILTWLFGGEELSDKPIWIDAEDTRNSLSPKTLLRWVKRLGAGLQKLGLRDDDVVLVHTTNHLFVPVAFFGIVGSGCVFTGCNPIYGVQEVKYQIQDTGAKLILADPSLVEVTLKAAELAAFPKERILLFDDKPTAPKGSLKDWSSILATSAEGEQWQWRRLSSEEQARKLATLNYSSGTTGLPKGVMITHKNIVSNVTQSLYMKRLRNDCPESLVTEVPEERWLGFLPMYHAFGQLWSISAAARSLTAVYLMRKFTTYDAWLQHIERHRITDIQLTPPLCVMLAKRPETKLYDLSSLRSILSGGAPLSADLQNEVMAIGENLFVGQTMGMTELTCSTVHTPGIFKDNTGSVGLADPNCIFKLVDDNGREVGDNERGELLVKGPNVCAGYWRNEEATKKMFDSDGFVRSGDIAIRENKWYWIIDRKKELIKVNGFQVAPAEVEATLLENEDISDAAVVGVRSGIEEKPRAYIVLKDHAKGRLRESDIALWLAERVAKYKRLTGGVEFVREIPKSPSGKIQRIVLRRWAAEVEEPVKARL